MPTYDYRCSHCKLQFEVFQKITDDSLSACPHCHTKGTVKRLISAGSGLIFKGKGFYATDYKKSYCGDAKKDVKSDCSACDKPACSQPGKKN